MTQSNGGRPEYSVYDTLATLRFFGIDDLPPDQSLAVRISDDICLPREGFMLYKEQGWAGPGWYGIAPVRSWERWRQDMGRR